MNPKYRSLFLLIGFAGFLFLGYDAFMTYPDLNPLRVLLIAFPDLIFFFLAYRTYPADESAQMKTSKVKSYQ